MKKEILRMIIPGNKIINDNVNNNYRAHMGKLKYLTLKVTDMIKNKTPGPNNFIIPDSSDINKIINKDGSFSLILEVWKCQQRFDVQNYSMTFKPLIDAFSFNGYWKDDNHKYCNPVIFNGGDFSNWKDRAFRYNNDNLPNEIDKNWWEENGFDPKKDTFVRIIINTNVNILKGE